MSKADLDRDLITLNTEPDTSYKYDNNDVQELILSYTKDLKEFSKSQTMKLGNRLKELKDVDGSGGELLLMPRDINVFDNLTDGHDFAYSAKHNSVEKEQDNLTPRLKEFRQVTQNDEVKALNKKVAFLVPIQRSDHWTGVVIRFDPDAAGEKYSYVFLNSLNDQAGGCPEDIKGTIKGVFGDSIGEGNSSGFFRQKRKTENGVELVGDGCGPCVVDNLMMNSGVIPGQYKDQQDEELRKKHILMNPDLAWRSIPKDRMVIEGLFLLDNRELRAKITETIQNNKLNRESMKSNLDALLAKDMDDNSKKEVFKNLTTAILSNCFDDQEYRRAFLDWDKINIEIAKLNSLIDSLKSVGKENMVVAGATSLGLDRVTDGDGKVHYQPIAGMDQPEPHGEEVIQGEERRENDLDSQNQLPSSALGNEAETDAITFINYLNANELGMAMAVLKGINDINDLLDIQESSYYKTNVDIKSDVGKTIDKMLTSYIEYRLTANSNTSKALKVAIDSYREYTNGIIPTNENATRVDRVGRERGNLHPLNTPNVPHLRNKGISHR